ncbi:DUF922 domain-containing protein [Roseivirga pacifica]
MFRHRFVVLFALLFYTQLSFAQKQGFLTVDTLAFIEWNEDRPISWEDYGVRTFGKKPSSFAITSVTHSVRGGLKNGEPNFQVKVLFVKKDSWTSDTTNVRLFEHERLHFDLAELYGRKIRKQIVMLGNQGIDKLSVYKRYVRLLLDEYKRKSMDYDAETRHGALFDQQQEWEEFVHHELERLIDFKFN